jgi:Flp pilus assembly protein TadG
MMQLLKRPKLRKLSRRRGGALIEAVLLMGVVISIGMGATEYGFAFYVKHALQQAASAGCRVAVLPGATDTQVHTAVNNQLSSAGFGSATPTITTTPASVNGVLQGTYVTVTVAVPWSQVGVNPLPTSLGGFTTNRNFSGSVTLLHE